MECPIINPTISLLMKHLVIGQRQKAPNFSAFHWSPHGSLAYIGQHFVTTKEAHLPKRTETRLIVESYQTEPNHQLLQLCTARKAWSESLLPFFRFFFFFCLFVYFHSRSNLVCIWKEQKEKRKHFTTEKLLEFVHAE